MMKILSNPMEVIIRVMSGFVEISVGRKWLRFWAAMAILASSPSVVLSMISLDYQHTLMAAAGHHAEAALETDPSNPFAVEVAVRCGRGEAKDAAFNRALTQLYAAIDSRVLEAADFSRSSELGDPLTFAARAHEFLVSGADVSLRGYTAEQIVLSALKADGHDVVLAATSNMKGFCRNKYKRSINTATCATAVVTVTTGLELGFSTTLKNN